MSLIDHVMGGGGAIAGGVDCRDSVAGVSSLQFDVDMLLFADGEMVGPDSTKFALELHCRQRAAAYVARHIRQAEAQSRDVAPVLSALAEIPILSAQQYPQGDFVASWVRRYASEYLRAIRHGIDGMREATLRRFENHQTLPKVYRREYDTG